MANEKNLIPMSKRTKSEQRELTSKAGKASGEARRRKKSMKQAMNTLLNLPVSETNKAKLKQLGVEPSEADNQMLVMVSAMQQALNGNVRAMEFIASITGNIAMSEAERERNKIEKKRLKIEEQQANKDTVSDDGTQDKMDAIDGILAQMQPLGDDDL